MPGRSMSLNSWFLYMALPSFFSTVTPGQLATFKLAPVNALKRVVLPQLGLPMNPTLMILPIMPAPPSLQYDQRSVCRKRSGCPGILR